MVTYHDFFESVANGEFVKSGWTNGIFNFAMAMAGADHYGRVEALRFLVNDSATVIGQEPPNTKRDLFNSSGGFLSTVNAGSTTSTFNSGPPAYYGRRLTAGTPESATNAGNVSVTTAASTTYSVSVTNQGIFTKWVLRTYASCTSVTLTITSSGGSVTHLSKSYTTTANANNTISPVIGDYTNVIPASTTVSITVAGTGSGISCWTGGNVKSFSGTNFSYTSQPIHACETGGTEELQFTPYTSGTGVVQTNAAFSSGSNITGIYVGALHDDDGSNLITYDASVDNGSTWTTSLATETLNKITSTAGNQLILKFNLPNNASAKLYGYSLAVVR